MTKGRRRKRYADTWGLVCIGRPKGRIANITRAALAHNGATITQLAGFEEFVNHAAATCQELSIPLVSGAMFERSEPLLTR
jgi:hypothetical protein